MIARPSRSTNRRTYRRQRPSMCRAPARRRRDPGRVRPLARAHASGIPGGRPPTVRPCPAIYRSRELQCRHGAHKAAAPLRHRGKLRFDLAAQIPRQDQNPIRPVRQQIRSSTTGIRLPASICLLAAYGRPHRQEIAAHRRNSTKYCPSPPRHRRRPCGRSASARAEGEQRIFRRFDARLKAGIKPAVFTPAPCSCASMAGTAAPTAPPASLRCANTRMLPPCVLNARRR